MAKEKLLAFRLDKETQYQLNYLIKNKSEFKSLNKSEVIRRCINIYYANTMEAKNNGIG